MRRGFTGISSAAGVLLIGWIHYPHVWGAILPTEFDLEELFKTYRWVLQEIQETAQRGSWYENHLACFTPGPCAFLPVKRSGIVIQGDFMKRRRIPTERCLR